MIKASSQQWIGTIRNLQKKGVSAIEIEWSEVMWFLGDDPEPNQTLEALVDLAAALSGQSAPTPAPALRPVVQLTELLEFLADRSPCELVLQRRVSND